MYYTIAMDAPHGESGGTMVRKIETRSALEIAQNIMAVAGENPGQEIVCKVTASEDVD